MRTINKKIIFLLMGISIVILMGATECTCSFEFDDYYGKAVNVKTEGSDTDYWKEGDTLTLEGAIVKLIPLDADGSYSDGINTITSNVDSSGDFVFTALIPNRYKLTGNKNGWTFVPRYIDIAGGMAFPDLLAYPTTDAGEITLITSWENEAIDVDMILTYGPDPFAGNVYSDSFTVSKWSITNNNPVGATERIKIQADGAAGSTDGIMINRDITSATLGPDSYRTAAGIPRVETITFYSGYEDWLDDGDVAYLYIDSFLDEESDRPYGDDEYQSLTGEEGFYASAYIQVDVMTGTTHFGTWVLPWNTSEDTLRVVRIDYNTATNDPITGTYKYMIGSAYNADVQYSGTTGDTDPSDGTDGIKSIIWE